MTTHEGNRLRETKVTFDSETKKASYLNATRQEQCDRPRAGNRHPGVMTAWRPVPIHLALEPGQSTQIPVSDGKKSVMVKVEAQAREDVKTPEGSFKTIRYEVYLFNGVLYRRPAHLTLWVSDDRRKLPVQIRVRMTFTIGTILLQLEKHE